MKFLRLGVIAAMAMALGGQQGLAADTAPKIDAKVHDQSMKDAPTLVQAAGLKCDVSDAYLIGTSDEKANGKALKSSFYEIACGPGKLGYIFKSVPGSDTQAYDCLALKIISDRQTPAEKAAAAKAKTTSTCGLLPANAEPQTALQPLVAQSGAPCASVTAADALGTSPSDKLTFFEASCSDNHGYVVAFPELGSTKTVEVIPCSKSEPIGAPCKLTTPDTVAKQIIALDSSNKHPNCKPAKGRWVVTDPSNGNDFYEIGCADGVSAYMIRTDSKGGFKEAIECTLATRIAGGCTYMNVNTGQTADNATYSKLAKQIGYDACPNVQKYQSYGTENGGQREIVELACSGTEGAYAFVPTGAGQTGEYFNCVRALGRELTCHLTPIEATYAKISQQIAARGKTTCKVTNGRYVGRDDKGVEYVDVACTAGDPQPEMVLQYSKLPQENLAQATTCAQAPIQGGCTLAGAAATAKK